jgi:hypothetical protein
MCLVHPLQYILDVNLNQSTQFVWWFLVAVLIDIYVVSNHLLHCEIDHAYLLRLLLQMHSVILGSLPDKLETVIS